MSSAAWFAVQRSDVVCTWTPLGPVTVAEGGIKSTLFLDCIFEN